MFTRDWKSGKIKIEESSIVIASGQHDLSMFTWMGVYRSLV